MKTMAFFRSTAELILFLFLSSTLAGQDPRPGIECGCDKYGDYPEPAGKAIKVEQGTTVQEGSSSKGKYTVRVVDAIPPNVVNISVYLGDRMIFNESNRAVGWGFSPDENKFVMHGLDQFQKHWCSLVNLDPDPSREGEQAAVFNVITPADFSSASIRFSPHGKYLLYAAISGTTGGLFLKVFDAKTGLAVYDGSTGNLVGSPSGKSIAGWGFSPDTRDATFVHAYLTDIDRYTLVVKNLGSPDGEYVLFAPGNQGEAHWFFSPCGDYFAWIIDSPLTGLICRLYRTDSGENYETVSAGTWWKLFSAADGHYIRYIDNSVLKITDNTADETCPDKTKPTWENASLEAGLVEGTTVELLWNGAKDNVGVTSYKIYKDNSPVKQTEAINSYTVTKLEPDSSYTFRIEAGDETGNWSTDGPEETFSTYPDNPPFWSSLSLTSKNTTETGTDLKWDPAGDDYGVLFYRILVNRVEAGRVGGDTLAYMARGLTAGTTDTFRIVAGDAAGQWTAGPELRLTMPPAAPPYWPAGAALSDSGVTETSLILKWPAALDQFNAVRRYKISMNGDSLAGTMYYTRECLVRDLEAGTLYYFEVIAYDESGNQSTPLTGYHSTLASYVLSPLITGPSNQKRPDISGNLVVWWDDRNDGGDIYSYDLSTDSLHRITSDPHIQVNPAVDGERIVWTDARNGNLDIYMYDPALGEMAVCTAPGDQDLAAINGDIIVWRDDRNKNWDIYMFDISTMQESPVCTRSSNQDCPDVSGPNIVYADDRNGNWDIYLFNIYTEREISICTNPADQTFPTVTGRFTDLAITYMDNRNGENIYIYYPVYIYELGIDCEYRILLPYNSGPANPHFEDKQLVWQDLLPLADGIHNSIWGYKFTGKLPWPVDKKITIGSENQINQTRPRTSRGNIVWQYDKGTDTDIYVWKRPRGSDLQLSLTVKPDPVMVGDTIKYILKLVNNGPNNNINIRTKVTLPVMAKHISSKKDRGEIITEGKNITWNIDTLRSGTETNLEITMLTYEIAMLEFRAETKAEAFETDPSNNQVSEKTKVKNVVARDVGEGGTPAMVVEDNGKVHLAYFRNDTLMYAFRNRADRKWEYRETGYCSHSQNISMVMTPDKNLYVIYSNYNREWYPAGRLFHGVITPSGEWDSKIIGISNRGFHSIAPDVTSDGELFLAWLEAPGPAGPTTVMIRRTVNGAWQTARLVFEEGFENIDLDVDPENNVHLSFYHLSNKSHILYQKWSGDLEAGPVEYVEPEWGSFPPGMEVLVTGKGTSVAANHLNQPVISYAGYANDDPLENINYARKQDGKWHFGKVDDGNYNNSVNKLATGPEGVLNFGYYHYPAKQLRFAANIAETWTRQVLDDDTTARWNLDMGMDGDHYGHMAMGVIYTGLAYYPPSIPPLPNPSMVKYALIPPLVYFNTDPDSLDFGAVETGSEKTLPIILSNPSGEKITIDTLTINDPRFRFNKTSFILKRLSQDTVYVTFSQTGNKGLETWLRIVYNSPSDMMLEMPVTVRSWGPALAADPDTVLFGAVPINTTATRTVSLQNNGLIDLVFSSLEVKYELWPGYPVETDFALAGHNCATIGPGQSCEVQVSFQPTKEGPQNSFLNISSNDPDTPEMKISISGNTPYAQLYTPKSSIDFGFCAVDEILPDTLILFNTGDDVLNITGMDLAGPDADQFSFNGSCTTITPGDSCSIEVMINPAREDDFVAELVITSNSLWSEVLNIPLSATSFVRTLGLSPESINFGNVHVADQSLVLLELRNPGSVGINVDQISLIGPDMFEFKDRHACYQIAAGTTCIDTIWFVPVFEGAKTGTLVISSNDSYKPVQTVSLTGQAGPPLPIQAGITAGPESGQEPLTVQFSSTVTGGHPPYSYRWDFDDSRTGNGPSPVHEFSTFGVYNVVMTVSDVCGNSLSDTINITVTTIPDNSLAGQLFDETGSNEINYSDVILIPESDISDTTLLILTGTNSYSFTGLETGQYTVLAIPDPLNCPEDLPTYLGNKIALFEAEWMIVTGQLTGKDILLVKKPALGSGSGSISGTLVSGPGKGLTVMEKTGPVNSDPVPDAYVYLERATDGKLMASDITGSDGSFSFGGLENRSYYFVADYQGKPMDNNNSPLVISDTGKSLEILAIVGTDMISVEDITIGTEEVIDKELQVYPVPAGNHLMVGIPGGSFTGNSVRIRILDLSGKYVFIDESFETTGTTVKINIGRLSEGIYLLEVADNNIIQRFKIMKMR